MSDLTKKSGIVYLSVFLLVICAAAGAIMTVTASLTDRPIKARQSDMIKKNLALVLPAFDTIEEQQVKTEKGIFTVFLAKKDGKTAGKAVKSSSPAGYGGPIEALVGFDNKGCVYRIVVTGHNETPGIGTKVVARKNVRSINDLFCGKKPGTALPDNAALDSYIGLNKAKIARENVHFISGATVSSRAVLKLVKQAAAIQAEVN